MNVTAQPISTELFAPYGRVLTAPAVGETEVLGPMLHFLDPASHLSSWLVSIRDSGPRWTIPKLERHPNSVQLFIPTDVERFVVVTALGDREPDLGTLAAFVVPSRCAIAYDIGVWHAPMRVVGKPGTFVVLMHRLTLDRDEEWHTLSEPLALAVGQRD